ncbi:MAG: TIGR03960 family B12-binding radical SAM protein [bacterium]
MPLRYLFMGDAIRIRDTEILPFVSRPSRYLGGEHNAIHKDPSAVRLKVALAFPDAYEIGMSHLGLKILYQILNSHPQILAERVFSPWIDAELLLRRKGLPLSSHESGLPLSSFDILGFTLQYELSYTNVLNMLDLAGIPPGREQRDERYPLLIAGGPCAFNPEPLADFIDLFVIGEAEEAILEVAQEYLSWKGSGRGREALLERLCRYPGIYCPAVHQPGRVIEKRLIADLDAAPHPTAFVVPFMEIVHDRANIEVGRGCSQGCRFCQAGMVFRPIRERSAECIQDLVLRSLRETGYEEVSLFSLNTTDHSCLEALLPLLMAHLEGQKISLSLPSIRVDGLSLKILNQIKRVRKTGLTLAPEAGSQRLRDVINKGLSEESVLEAVRAAASAGWEGMKLYFMIGLPTEKEEDLLEIARLAREAVRAGKRERGKGNFRLTVSISSFIPKPHTPFQWAGQAPIDELKEKHRLLREQVRGHSLELKWQLPEMSFLEAVFSRGDRALGQALLRAHSLGCRFDGWTDQLRYGLWQAVFSDSDIDPGSYSYRQFDPQAPLPWDHISAGLSKDFLLREYQKALAGEGSPDCQFDRCLNCGIGCPPGRRPPAPAPLSLEDIGPKGGVQPPREKTRVRFSFQKGEEVRYLSHLELLRAFARALRRASIPIAYSQGFHPQPRLTIAWALPVGVSGEAERGEMELEGVGPLAGMRECLNRHLPRGLSVLDIEEVPSTSRPLELVLSKAGYAICLEAGLAEEWKARHPLLLSSDAPRAFLSEGALPTRIKRKEREVITDIKPLLVEFFLQEGVTPPSWGLTLRISSEGGISPRKVMARFLSNYLDEDEADQLVLGLKITRKALL